VVLVRLLVRWVVWSVESPLVGLVVRSDLIHLQNSLFFAPHRRSLCTEFAEFLFQCYQFTFTLPTLFHFYKFHRFFPPFSTTRLKNLNLIQLIASENQDHVPISSHR
jgi:hypothetical protein